LLVDYFLRVEASQAGGSLSGQARAAERVAEILRLVTNQFEFDLLSRKAAEMLGVSEQLLRNQVRPQNRGAKRTVTPAVSVERFRTSAVAEAQAGMLAIAMIYPELRTEIVQAGAHANFDDRALAELLIEVCDSDDAGPGLQTSVSERLADEPRRRVSALLVGSLIDDLASARKLSADYAAALQRRRRKLEVEGLARGVREADEKEAPGKAQDVISLRREANRAP
jgi:DNA primase